MRTKVTSDAGELDDNFGSLKRFRLSYTLSPAIDETKQLKIRLVSGIGVAESIRDYGGLYGVHGLYLLEGAKALGCNYAEMIDITPREEFWQHVAELQAETDIRVEMKQADFRDPELFKVIRPVDVSLLYEVLLHQDNVEEVIKNVLSRTRIRVCLAQPVLKEDLFVLPGGCVNLQFYPSELKDLLRIPGWWPQEPTVDRFDVRYWMWGQTISYFQAVFRGYGWDVVHLEAYSMSNYWNYALMMFAPRSSSVSRRPLYCHDGTYS